VIGDSPSFVEAQTRSWLWQLHTAASKLQAIQQTLSGYESSQKGRNPSGAEIRSRVEKVLSHDHVHQLITYTISERKHLTVTFPLDDAKIQESIERYSGKAIHMTNRTAWSAVDIIQAYRDQAIIEACIKDTKGMKHSLWWPMGHWTDQNIHVHGFYTFLALLLKSLVQKKLQDHGIRRSWHAVVSDLDEIYEVVDLVAEHGELVPRMRLSTMTDHQEQLFRVLL